MSNKIKIGIIGGSGGIIIAISESEIFQNKREEAVTTIFGEPSGTIGDIDCVLLSRHGRHKLGKEKNAISPTNVNYRANIWALKEAGCTHLIATTACGSLREEVVPGDLVVLDSFIDRTTKREQSFFDGKTLRAPSGICHLPMEPAFDNKLRKLFCENAEEMKLKFHPKGVCVTIEGPRFSSYAESHVFRSWGATVINMTLVPEVVLAKEAGILYAAVAMATDYDCWRDIGEKVTVEAVMKIFRLNAHNVTELFLKTIPKIAEMDWTKDLEELKQTVKGNTM